MHSRRETEDIETFTAYTRAMREMELARYLATDLGRLEARLQLITFGTDHRQPVDSLSDQEMLRSARALAQSENVILAPSERSPAFMEVIADRLAFRPGPLRQLNANEPAILAAHLSEVHDAIGLIKSINAGERDFYDFVCRCFDELRTAGRRWRGLQNRLLPVLNASRPSPAKMRTAVG